MEQIKYLILGAGPSGLSFANRLRSCGENSFLVLEAEDIAGGLCRSQMVDGSPLDIGGGHFLDTRRPAVNQFLFEYMDESEWDTYNRNSQINIAGTMVGYPLEAHIWQLPEAMQEEYLRTIALAGGNQDAEMPQHFVDWIYWKLGKSIADDYMLPYNKKLFGDDLNQLGTYWLEKLPQVSYEETKLSCQNKRRYGKDPGHSVFLYPKKYGYGELWLRMADALENRILYGQKVVALDLNQKMVGTTNGEQYQAEHIVVTIPWSSMEQIQGLSVDTQKSVMKLKHTGVVVAYQEQAPQTEAQWIYYPNPELSYHRILVRENFCPGSRGCWTETNPSRFEPADQPYFRNEFAYPLNTIEKPRIMRRLLEEAAAKQVYGLGRWGEHQHYNSDVVVELALALADRLMQ